VVYRHPGASVPPELVDRPLFPIPTALQLWNLGTFFTLFALHRKSTTSGGTSGVFLAVYGLGRYLVGNWAAAEPVVLGMKEMQLTGMGLALVGLAFLAAWSVKYLHYPRINPRQPPAPMVLPGAGEEGK
jgi:prolipoprotein diacylglyceryltransferase